jgi:hypothetical protein
VCCSVADIKSLRALKKSRNKPASGGKAGWVRDVLYRAAARLGGGGARVSGSVPYLVGERSARLSCSFAERPLGAGAVLLRFLASFLCKAVRRPPGVSGRQLQATFANANPLQSCVLCNHLAHVRHLSKRLR